MLKYIELKTEQSHKGPAWIARVTLSRSGTTVYFNGKALKRGTGVSGNHFDTATGDEYWVSGVKKDGSDRHWAGSGKVAIEASAVPEYLDLIGAEELDETRLQVIEDLPETDPGQFHALEMNHWKQSEAVEQRVEADGAGTDSFACLSCSGRCQRGHRPGSSSRTSPRGTGSRFAHGLQRLLQNRSVV